MAVGLGIIPAVNNFLNMKKAVIILLCFFFLALCSYLILVFTIKFRIDLPGGFYLCEINRKIGLCEQNGVIFLEPGIMGFKIHGDIFYGWRNTQRLQYFVVHLDKKEKKLFESIREFNSYLKENRIPLLEMSGEKTFWDLKKEGKARHFFCIGA